ncbi:enoyl-CoA hydratase/isomerase family protein [Nocardioides cavernaquae]|uniref:Enoyl-CoA hydratase/isomerase family protein n=1 Tax=Nocardioides cavernaquae TaxID=2321396 RepID=A0A3A5HFE7_9ACTN|nr:enoyl-CoA hydratase/isomerase family protein [Nocardioides cavernaquae]RJS46764.1 enoyl-CoA hydratase/isomerase family protein [Nocardioides cavernaquae]
MSHVTHHVENQVAVLTIEHAPQNRIGDQMVAGLVEALDAIERSDARALVLQAAGADFCFGGDIRTWPETSSRELRASFTRYLDVFNRLEQLPMPVVAAVQGMCLGGGFELALRADVIIAGESAHFGHPEQSIAITTIMGGIYRVAERAGRARAIEWAFTSERVPAQEMANAGVVNRVVADDVVHKEALALAEQLARGPTLAHAAHKALLRTWSVGGVAAADQAMFDISMPLFETDDAQLAMRSAVKAMAAGQPRPDVEFQGR